MKCAVCGKEFHPSGRGIAQRYCSKSCKNHAAYLKRKANAGKPKAKAKRKAKAKTEEPTKATPAEATSVELDRRQFNRMMDDSLEDVLRANRDRLREALDAPDTPANALAAISRQLIAVCEKLEHLAGADPLTDLFEDEEVPSDAGASLV
jgi:molecular chaperone DnaK (HSP70)|nr:MAG TPA: DNA gyrase inhibitor [Bacteriophage sp.]